MLAISEVEVEYVGANAHATLAWEGINALDAAVLAYNNISALRQQVQPSHRIHGIIQGSEDWVCNSWSFSSSSLSLSLPNDEQVLTVTHQSSQQPRD